MLGNWTILSGYLQGDISYELNKVSTTTSYVNFELVAYGKKWEDFDFAFEYRFDNKSEWLDDAVITQTSAKYLRGNKLYGLTASTNGSSNTMRWQYSSNSIIYGTTPQIRIRFLPRVRVFGSSNFNHTIASLYGDSLINFDGMSKHDCIGVDENGYYMCLGAHSFYLIDSLDAEEESTSSLSSSSSSSLSSSSLSSSSSSIDSSSSSSSSSYDRPFGSGFTTHTNCNGEWFYEGIASGYPFYTKVPGDLSLILVFGTDWSVNSYIIADSPVTYIYQRSPDSTDINGTYNLFGGGAEGTIS